MKRSSDDASHTRASAIRLLGETVDGPYMRAVVHLSRMSISSPGRKVLSKYQSAAYLPTAQYTRRHRVPDDIARLSSSGDMFEYARLAQLIESPYADNAPVLPDDLRDAVRFTCAQGEGISAWRCARLHELMEISISLRPMSERILLRRPEHVAWAGGPDVHPAFVAAIIDALGFPDTSLAVEVYLTGLPIVGRATDTGLWRRRNATERLRTGPKITVCELRSSNLRFTQLLLSSLPQQFAAAQRKGDAEWLRLNELTWKATMEEVNVKKSARGPFTRSQMDAKFGFGRWRPIRRFGQPKGDGVRPCDDATQSLHNSAFVSDHVVSSCPYDFPAAVARAFFDESRALASPPIGSIGGAKEDVPNAYRTVPAATPELTVAALAHPRSGRVCFFETRGLNFGLAGSGVNFVRLPTCITFAARRLLAVPADIFTDDEQIVESTLSRGPPVANAHGLDRFPGSAHSAFVSFCGMLAFPLSQSKREEWSTCPVGLGVRSDLSRAHIDGSVSQRIATPARTKALVLVATALRTGLLHPGTAGSLRGKLGHLFSRSAAARAALAPISERQYALAIEGHKAWSLSETLRGALHFVEDMLGGRLPDLMYYGPQSRGKPVIIFSDASFSPPVPPRCRGSGRVAFVVFTPDEGRVVWAAADVPGSLMDHIHAFKMRKTLIIPLEAMALFSALFAPELQPILAGADIVHFADNQTVNGIAVKNYSAAPDVGRMLSSYSLRLAALAARSWVHYVPSALNIADPPSRPPATGRPECYELLNLGRMLHRIDFVFPAAFSWTEF